MKSDEDAGREAMGMAETHWTEEDQALKDGIAEDVAVHARVAALHERYNGKDDRARIIFGLDAEGNLGAYVHLDFAIDAVGVPGNVQEVGPELDLFVEQMRFAHLAGFHGWLQKMGSVCPLCAGKVEESKIETALVIGDLRSTPSATKFICAKCSWSPAIPQVTNPLGGPNHG